MTWLDLEQRRDAERPKGATGKVRRLTRFVEYGLMLDSRLSFCVEYELIGSPY